MTGRVVRLARGVSSLVAVVVLAVGVPVLLARIVGWPLPTKLPTVDEVSLATRSGIADSTIAKTIAVVAWIAWLQVAAALVAETAAVLKGRSAVRLPVLPGVQVFAARLVAGVLLLTATLQTPRALAAPTPFTIAPAVTVAATAPVSSGPAALTGDSAPLVAREPASTAPAPMVTVRRHDSYWAIAERTLGDGLRWHEIHRLNAGRTLGDGTVIPADDTLHAGWQLLLPRDATVPAAQDIESPSPAVRVVEHGDNLWDIAETTVESDLGHQPTAAEIAPEWAEIIELNRDVYVEPGNPNLIYPGQVIKLAPPGPGATPPAADDETTTGQPVSTDDAASAPPADPASSPNSRPSEAPPNDSDEPATTTLAPTSTSGAEATSTTTSDGDTPRRVPDQPPPSAHAPDDGSNTDESNAGEIAAGALASVALAVGLRRLITRRRRRAADNGPLAPPDETHRALSQLLTAQADEERTADLRSILAGLATALAATGSARRPRIIRHTPSSIELLLDQPDPQAPAGWVASEDGAIWTADDTSTLPLGSGCAAPLLVTIGEPDGDAQLYLDVETDALWALTGGTNVAADLARSILTELTVTPLADALRVIAVGNLVPDNLPLDHLTVVATWADISDDLEAWADESHAALDEAGWANAFVARGVDPDNDVLAPLVVIADYPPPDDFAHRLLTSRPGSFAVVAIGSFDGAEAISCAADELHLPIAGISCDPQRLTGDELAHLAPLLAEPEPAAMPDPSPAADVATEQLSLGVTTGAPTASGPPEYDVIVRLLGDITVEGGKSLKPKATSVVAYIALQRSVSTERLEEACWFGADGVSHRKRLRDTLTQCRDAIGSQHLPPNRNSAYIAGPRLRTDLELFDWHVDRASLLDADHALDHYKAALNLVQGKPFSYTNAARASFGWVDFEHHATTWEHRVAGVAQAASALLSDRGQHDDAIVLLRRVAQAIPLNSSVVEALIRTHLAAGDDRGARAVYDEHVDALEQAGLGEPTDAVEALFAA